MVAAIEAGFPQREIERRAYEHQRAVEEKRRVIVGENAFAESGPASGRAAQPGAAPAGSRAGGRPSCERLRAFRAGRDGPGRPSSS